MPTATRICKVCGKEYEYCHTNRPATIFRWQDVACSPEHGAEYFRQVAISRGEVAPAEEDRLESKDDKVVGDETNTAAKELTLVKPKKKSKHVTDEQ